MSPPKRPIVLVHGLIGGFRNSGILSAFGDADIHAPDLIGYGEWRDADVSHLRLDEQAEHVATYIRSISDIGVHLVGHSVGGAVSALVCRAYPGLIASFISVEGNFSLDDAFWSGQIAAKRDEEVAEIIEGYKADPDAWISAAGVPITPWTSALAREWLENQPAATIKAQANAVVMATGRDDYLTGLRDTMASDKPVHLIAGVRSASDWHVPEWANQACTSRVNIRGTGHLMMAENPELFAKTVLACISCP
jgi:pimeloyl-ACP methyl ester carboxylesterase